LKASHPLVAPARLAVGFEDRGWDVVTVAIGAVATTDGADGTADATFQLIHARRDVGPQGRTRDVRFSPDGQYLAVGCADAAIYLYGESYSLLAVCRGHSSAITHIDWTEDSCVLRSNCMGHELRFWDVPSGEQITLASACRDLSWSTYTVTLGWHCQGIFNNRADGKGIYSVDRSGDGTLLATADEFGMVNLLRYPCVQAQARGKPNRREFSGHSSSALACRWVRGESHEEVESLLSVGGLDLTLFQWRRK